MTVHSGMKTLTKQVGDRAEMTVHSGMKTLTKQVGYRTEAVKCNVWLQGRALQALVP